MLYILSLTTTILGDLARAAEHLTELRQVRDVLGMSAAQQEMFRNSEYLAWRGEEDGLRETIDSTGRAAVALGLGGAETVARTALMIVDIYQGDYEAAYQIARRNRDLNFMQISVRVLPDLVEAAVRTDRIEQATIALHELREIATASGTSWALGLLERSAGAVAEARVAGDLDDDPADEPESHYAAAIVHLTNSHARADLARTHLMYGEWLRRRKRRRDARVQLRAAADQFQSMGANGFAARALRELAATGSPAGTGAVESADSATTLTVQEQSVARLAADGATNATIATTLILSPHTVDYHLRKVYRKLGIGTRRELRTALGGQIPRG
jgi:DNA-binding CsgD family transcriptional regulator